MPSNKRGIARSGEHLAYVNGIGSFENPHSLRCACCRHPFFLAGPAGSVLPTPFARLWTLSAFWRKISRSEAECLGLSGRTEVEVEAQGLR